MSGTDEVDKYIGRKITFNLKSGFIDEAIVRSDCKNHHPWIDEAGTLHFISPGGFRSVRTANIKKISRKRY